MPRAKSTPILDTQNSKLNTPFAGITIRSRFLRSVNLERDFYAPDALNGYIPTPAARAALARITAGIVDPAARAVTLTGAYGTGKSAFALLLTKTLALPPVGGIAVSDRAGGLSPADKTLSAEFNITIADKVLSAGDKPPALRETGFFPVLITGGRQPIAPTMANGLRDALQHLDRFFPEAAKATLLEMPEPDALNNLSARDIARLYEETSAALMRRVPGCRGLLVVADEMGKFLEFAAQRPERGDLQVLQELAEVAVRSGDAPILFVTILHQAFDEYAHRLGAVQRAEWQKVQGRFADIPFSDAPEENLRLLAEAIGRAPDPARDALIQAQSVQDAQTCVQLHLAPRTLSEEELASLFARTYPLHPLTLLILPHLFRRFGQSERSLFSFLTSDAPYALRDFLASSPHPLTPSPADGRGGRGEDNVVGASIPPLPSAGEGVRGWGLLRPTTLFDYLAASHQSTVQGQPAAARLWRETQEALYRAEGRNPLDVRLIKTIGLLYLLSEQTRILPTRNVLRFALADGKTSPDAIDHALDALHAATLITFRRWKGEGAYRPYEGGEVDVEARLREARQEIGGVGDVTATAARYVEISPVVARRHSFRTGSLRLFDTRMVRPDALLSSGGDAALTVTGGVDGLRLLVLCADPVERAAAEVAAQRITAENSAIVISLSLETDALRESAIALDALRWLQENTPELRNDKVAEREVKERIEDAEIYFLAEWEALLRPEPEFADSASNTAWFWNGEQQALTSSRNLQRLLSRACDVTYPRTPILRNELVNRRALTSVAAGARGELIKGMIESRDRENLDIDGFPPQRAMYETLLKDTGIHRQEPTEDGFVWGIHPPGPDSDPALSCLWQDMEAFFFSGELRARPATDFNVLLTARPYGVAEGIIPILLCAGLLYWQNEIAVYEDDIFVKELDAATFERLIKRPEDFKLQGVRISGERQALVERFARGLLTVEQEPTLVNIVRALYQKIARLPEYAMKTRRLKRDAMGLRDLLTLAKSPEQLIFVEMPNLLGVRPFTADTHDADNIERFFARLNPSLQSLFNVCNDLTERIASELYQAFNADGADDLRARALKIRPHITEPELAAFVQRVADESLTGQKWLESVAAVVVGRPPFAWTDTEEKKFEANLSALSSAFNHAELVSFAIAERKAAEREITPAQTVNPAESFSEGLRVAFTRDTGEENAKIFVVSRTQRQVIEEHIHKLMPEMDALLNSVPPEMRVAVLSGVLEAFMKERIK